MNNIILDGRDFVSKEVFHSIMKSEFNLASYYGENLDALWDMLSERQELDISILHKDKIVESLSDYGEAIIKLFEDLNEIEGNNIVFIADNENEDYTIKSIRGMKPQIDSTAYIAEGARLIGNITLMENTSIWYNATIRADYNKIVIGKNSNVQDNAVIHLSHDSSVEIGNNVTIGHSAIVHGAKVEDNVIIGMGATILDHAIIGKNTIIGANSLVTMNKRIPDGSLVMGSPAKVVRELSEEEIESITKNALDYVNNAKIHNK